MAKSHFTTTGAPVVGGTYRVNHSRKGAFTAKVLSVDETWADLLITDGKAAAMLDCNVVEVGEKVTVRLTHCRFAPLVAA